MRKQLRLTLCEQVWMFACNYSLYRYILKSTMGQSERKDTTFAPLFRTCPLPHVFGECFNKMPDFGMFWLYMRCHPRSRKTAVQVGPTEATTVCVFKARTSSS